MTSFAVTSPTLSAFHAHRSQRLHTRRDRSQVQALAQAQLQYNKLGDSDLLISEVTLGTMTFGEQNTEKEAHDMLSYSFDQGINILDTAEMVRYIGVSNETSFGIMEFVHAAKAHGLPKIVSIQNIDLVEVCHPNNCNVGLLAYSPLAGGVLTGKYLDASANISNRSRLNLFPGYMARYNASLAKEATNEYVKLAKKHGLTPVQLALGFVRDRPFTTSSIIGATNMDQLKENIDAFTSAPRPLPQEVLAGIEDLFKRYKDPAIL
nr:unnamed protein product [Digitaria exilis]